MLDWKSMSDKQKAESTYLCLQLETINSFTKADILNMLRFITDLYIKTKEVCLSCVIEIGKAIDKAVVQMSGE